MNTTHPPLRGVNLGGWLVLEKWMTPSLFEGTDAVDEYTLMQTPGAAERVERHRQTFITEADFAWLEKNGMNAVRIPVGYWLFGDEAPYAATDEYLDWAVAMAGKYHLQVLIDLHGAPGSQNGRDHSGRIGKSNWYKHKKYRQRTIEILEQIAQRYYTDTVVWGIELLNEPKFGIFHLKLRWFYRQAYRRLTKVARPGTRIVFSDAFAPWRMSGALLAKPDYPVVMDIHWYKFGGIVRRWHRSNRYLAKAIARLQQAQPVIIGEWSAVLSQNILRGKSKDASTEAIRRHSELQIDAYQHAAGWFYWNYKVEGRGFWHFRSLVEDGVISLDQQR